MWCEAGAPVHPNIVSQTWPQFGSPGEGCGGGFPVQVTLPQADCQCQGRSPVSLTHCWGGRCARRTLTCGPPGSSASLSTRRQPWQTRRARRCSVRGGCALREAAGARGGHCLAPGRTSPALAACPLKPQSPPVSSVRGGLSPLALGHREVELR